MKEIKDVRVALEVVRCFEMSQDNLINWEHYEGSQEELELRGILSDMIWSIVDKFGIRYVAEIFVDKSILVKVDRSHKNLDPIAKKYYDDTVDKYQKVIENFIAPNSLFERTLRKAYDEYRMMPLASIKEESEIYKKGWCEITGLSIVPPHPHRHYTFVEFAFNIGKKEEMRDRFIKTDKDE